MILAPKTALAAVLCAVAVVALFPLLVAAPLAANLKFVLYIGVLLAAFCVVGVVAEREAS
jgi:hypothetical protein